jgi:hypothetical protein
MAVYRIQLPLVGCDLLLWWHPSLGQVRAHLVLDHVQDQEMQQQHFRPRDLSHSEILQMPEKS